jgi:hypothetical protein
MTRQSHFDPSSAEQCGSYISMDADYGRNLDRDRTDQSLRAEPFRVSDDEPPDRGPRHHRRQVDRKPSKSWKLTSNFTGLTIN